MILNAFKSLLRGDSFAFSSTLAITDPCDIRIQEADVACINLLSPQEKKAALIYYLCLWLAAEVGSGECDVDTIAQNAKCLAQESYAELDSMEVLIACQSASSAGASVDCGDINALQEAIKCIKLLDPKVLRAAEIYYRCQLREQISPPIL